MATNTAGTTARYDYKQLVHYYRFAVNWNDAGIASGVQKRTLPSGAMIIGTDVFVNATFNANSTNVLTVGTNGLTANNIVASGDVSENSATTLHKDITPSGDALGALSADSPVYVKYAQTGPTVATQGSAIVVIKYIPNNDD
jgi:hypothetical protein